jgi:putative oxidoreductase
MKHNDGMHDLALLVARAVLGGSIAAHGAQKLFGWFGGPGIDGAAQLMQSLGFAPGDRYARLASISEIAAGVLIASGAGGPIGPALLVSVMGTAVGSVHLKKGFWAQNGGYELNVMYALAALLLAVEDHGRISIDGATGLREHARPMFGWLALAAAAAGAGYALSQRTPPPQMQAQSQPASSERGTIDAQQTPA